MRRVIGIAIAGVAALGLTGIAAAATPVDVHVQRQLAAGQNVHLTFHARQLPKGGYYYGVIVLQHYKHYTRASPPPCATSSNMQRTDYGYPRSNREVALVLAPAKSLTRHWCPAGEYTGAIYAVPHPPPCESKYPCRSEPYERPCAGVGPGCVHGVVQQPGEWRFPQGLPTPLAKGAAIVGRFTVRFPST